MAAAVWSWAPKSSQTNKRDAEQPDHGDGVGHGEHPVKPGSRTCVGGGGPVGLGAGTASPVGRLHAVESRGSGRPGPSPVPRGRRARPRVGLCQAGPVPRFEPFRGLRYDPARVRIDEVIAPPYDVDRLGRAGQRWPAATPCNSVRLELPEPDLRGRPVDRYEVAAELLAAWRSAGCWSPTEARLPVPLPDDHGPTAGRPPGSSGPSALAEPGARRRRRCPTSRPCPSPGATGSTCCGPPGPTSRPSGACRWPPG